MFVLIASALLCTFHPLAHAETPLLNLRRSAPMGITVVPPHRFRVINGRPVPTYMTVTQHIIPRYMYGGVQPAGQPERAVGPAGQLVGWGPASVIRGNAQTQNQPAPDGPIGVSVPAVVQTEDFGENTAQWSAGEHNEDFLPAVLRPIVRDLTIVGHDETGSDYLIGGVVNNSPGIWNRISGEITASTNTAPIVITSPGHSLPRGAEVTITGVQGNTAANGIWTITTIDPDDAGPLTGNDAFSLNGSDGTSARRYTGGGTWTSNHWRDLYGGLYVQASGANIENVTAFYIPGTAFLIQRGGSKNDGAFGPWDVEKTVVWNCDAHRAYRGFDIHVIDTSVGKLQGYALRDYGIKFTAAACQIDGSLHFWGVYPGPALWFAAGAGHCWGGPIYAESSPVGILIESSHNTLGHVYSKSCATANLHIKGNSNKFSQFNIRANPLGVLIEGGQFSSFHEGEISTATGATALKLATGNAGQGVVIQDVKFSAFEQSNAIGIDADVTINDTTIIATFIGGNNVGSGNVCIDLNDGGTSRIGVNNHIRITTRNWTTNDTKIDLPATWSDTNTIIVDGDVIAP